MKKLNHDRWFEKRDGFKTDRRKKKMTEFSVKDFGFGFFYTLNSQLHHILMTEQLF